MTDKQHDYSIPGKDAHLKQLPEKSFDVAVGDVIGGMVFAMDKPSGIEEGMAGISVASEPYRKYIEEQILNLLNNTNDNTILKKRFDEKLLEETKLKSLGNKKFSKLVTEYKESNDKNRVKNLNKLIDAVMQDSVHKKIVKAATPSDTEVVNTGMQNLYLQNVGMGGLLFKEYKKEVCKIDDEKDPFYVHNEKLMAKDDEVWMIKQDGQMILGGTGPSLKRILNTTMGKKLSTLIEPKWLIPTLGLSGVVFGAVALGWKGYYLVTNNPLKANSDAIRETIATKMTGTILGGDTTQTMDTLEGTYKKGKPKIVMGVKWTKGLDSFDIVGGKSNSEGVAVSVNAGQPIKTSLNGRYIYQNEVVGTKEVEKKVYFIDPITNKRHSEKKMVTEKIFGFVKIDTQDNNKKTAIDRKEYDAGFSVSDDKVYGMGKSLIMMIRLGDTDTIGSKGQNKGKVPFDGIKDKDGKPLYTHQFYGIDFGKAYQAKNPIVDKLNDDFSFVKPDKKQTYKNYSMLYDNPLTDKMQGVYLLAAIRGQLTDKSVPSKEEIAADYEKLGDSVFAAKLRNCPIPDPGEKNADIKTLDKEIKKYFELAVDAKNSKDKSIQKKSSHYTSYAKDLIEVKMIAEATDLSILNTFEKRLQLTPTQINLLDNIEKLTAKKATTLSPDGDVLLNHIKVDREDRIPWQITPIKDGDTFTYRLYCDTDSKDLNAVIKKLKKHGSENPQINTLIQSLINNPKINNILEITLTQADLKTFTDNFSEENVAQSREDLKGQPYRSKEVRHNFYAALDAVKLSSNADANVTPKTQNEFAALFSTNSVDREQPTLLNEKNSENLVDLLTVENEQREPNQNQSLSTSAQALIVSKSTATIQNNQSEPTNLTSDTQPYLPQRNSTVLTGDIVAVQDSSLKNVIDYLKKPEALSDHKNIKNIQELKSLSMPSETSTQPQKPIVLNLKNPESKAEINVSLKQAQFSNQVQYFAPKNLEDKEFEFIAREICRLAVLSAQPGAKFDFSKAPQEKQTILIAAFEAAVKEAVENNKFTKENAPSLKAGTSKQPVVPVEQAQSQSVSSAPEKTTPSNNEVKKRRGTWNGPR